MENLQHSRNVTLFPEITLSLKYDWDYNCITMEKSYLKHLHYILYHIVFTVKEALPDHNCAKSVKTQRRIPTQTCGASVGPQPPSIGELFQKLSVSEKEELLFIQLPDTVPVPIKALKSDKSVKKSDSEDKRASHIKAQVS